MTNGSSSTSPSAGPSPDSALVAQAASALVGSSSHVVASPSRAPPAGPVASTSHAGTTKKAATKRKSAGNKRKHSLKQDSPRGEADEELDDYTNNNATSNKVKKIKVGARASIACHTCRKRKVRCSGTWPVCDFCQTRNLDCEYDGHPQEGQPLHQPAAPQQGANNNIPSASFPFASIGHHRNSVSMDIDTPLPPTHVILEALDPFFLHNYDHFYFLHRPSLTEQIRLGAAPRELILCILAFAARFSSTLKEQFPQSPFAASEHWANLAAMSLASPLNAVNDPSTSDNMLSHDPEVNLIRCQCSLMLGFFECTQGQEAKGWLRIGWAIRMCQVMRLGFEDEEDVPLSPSARSDPVQAEARRRTFWACFLLDRAISDGKDRPVSLKPPVLNSLRMPISDADWHSGKTVKGARFDPYPPRWTLPASVNYAALQQPEADLYGHVLRVSELWQQVVTFIGNGGRYIADRRAPWLPESSFAMLEHKLKEYKKRLPAVFEYSEANLIAHSMIGQGRLFGLLHLLYECAVLLLHRDYLPFLPEPGYDATKGPIDGEPLLDDPVPPPDWWHDSYVIGMQASNRLSDLCYQLSKHGSAITHPFAGYAALASATVHCIMKHWPQRVQVGDPSHYLEQDREILAGLRGIYPLAVSWCVGLSKLQFLHSNLVRGVINRDEVQTIRSSVIKLLQTKQDEAAASASRSASMPPTSTASLQNDTINPAHHSSLAGALAGGAGSDAAAPLLALSSSDDGLHHHHSHHVFDAGDHAHTASSSIAGPDSVFDEFNQQFAAAASSAHHQHNQHGGPGSDSAAGSTTTTATAGGAGAGGAAASTSAFNQAAAQAIFGDFSPSLLLDVSVPDFFAHWSYGFGGLDNDRTTQWSL